MPASRGWSRSRRWSFPSLTTGVDLRPVGVVIVQIADRHRLRDVLAEAGALADGGTRALRVLIRREVDEPGVAGQVDAGTAELGGAGLAAAVPLEAERPRDLSR